VRALIIAAFAGLASACASTPPQVSVPDTAEEATQADTCGIARFRHLIGTRAEQIDRATLPQGTRVITPDMAVTMDFRAERLNIMVGTNGLVGSMRCF
jgi:hypothetical protein